MNGGLLLRMSLARLGRFRLQTTLMSVGIVISVCATTLIALALVNSRDRFTLYFSRIYPTNAVVLTSHTGNKNWDVEGLRLTIRDVEAIASAVKDVQEWDPLVFSGQRLVRIGTNSTMAVVLGNSERAQRIRNRDVSAGDYFSAADISSRARVALLGSSIAATLFPQESAIGQQISIDGIPFKVKGVLEKIGLDPHGNDQDDIIQLPYTTLMEQVDKVDALTSVTFVLGDPSRMKAVARRISDVLREIHPYDPNTDDPFPIVTPVDIQKRFEKSFGTIEIFVALAAGIGFVLSGVVIATVMVLSIKSRTSEIGLRKAIGARASDVQRQLLIEAALVAVTAASIGLVAAKAIVIASAPMLVHKFGLVMHQTPVLTISGLVLASVVTAVLSTSLVARRAARLDPVVALRQK